MRRRMSLAKMDSGTEVARRRRRAAGMEIEICFGKATLPWPHPSHAVALNSDCAAISGDIHNPCSKNNPDTSIQTLPTKTLNAF